MPYSHLKEKNYTNAYLLLLEIPQIVFIPTPKILYISKFLNLIK